MQWGFAKTEKGAERVLLGITIAGFVIMCVVIFFQINKGPQEYRSPDQLRAENGFVGPIPILR